MRKFSKHNKIYNFKIKNLNKSKNKLKNKIELLNLYVLVEKNKLLKMKKIIIKLINLSYIAMNLL